MKDAKAVAGYARALLEIGAENSAKLHEELLSFSQIVTLELLNLSRNPDFNYEEKRGVLEAIAAKIKLTRPALAVVLLLAEHRNLHLLGDILQVFHQLSLKAEGKALLTITSATVLSSKVLSEIEKMFGDIVKKKFAVQTQVDPNLLGGVVVAVGSKVYDGSVRGRFQQLSTELLAGS